MTTPESAQLVCVIDDDEAVRDSMSMLLESVALPHQCFASADEFLAAHDGSQRGCLVIDIRMPGTSGLALQHRLARTGSTLPIIFITGHGDVPMAVEAMRQGAFDFLRKPLGETEFIERIQLALNQESGDWRQNSDRRQLQRRITGLTRREGEIFNLVAGGMANKAIAHDLGISERTVEVHRARVMKKLGASSLAQLVRMHIAAG